MDDSIFSYEIRLEELKEFLSTYVYKGDTKAVHDLMDEAFELGREEGMVLAEHNKSKW